MTTIMLSACEPSGDALGVALMEALRAEVPGIRFIGGGGADLRSAGLANPIATDALAVMGPLDAVSALPKALRLATKFGKLAAREKPDVAVLIDSWAFSRIVAERIRKASPQTKLVKLAVPQVWASRPRRAGTAAELFDLLLCLLPFEPSHFKEKGGNAVFVGNPNFQSAARRRRSGSSFRARHQFGKAPLLILLPGSRSGEIKYLLPVYEECIRDLPDRVKGLRTVIVAADPVFEKVSSSVQGWQDPPVVVPASERFDAFDAADVAIAASGTVTTELALSGTPMIVTYKVGPVVAYWAKRVITTPYITLLNILAGEEIVPERVQDECMAAQLSADAVRLFTNEDARRRQLSAFRRLVPRLTGSGDAAQKSAQAILRLIDRHDSRDLHRSAAG